jgi:CheY-like chemotaxis protein
MESGNGFDLVLSDLTIEHGLGGVETMRALKQMDPQVLAIVSSGYSDAPAMARPDAFGFSAVLPKPYPPRELRTLVNEMLQGRWNQGDEAVFPA